MTTVRRVRVFNGREPPPPEAGVYCLWHAASGYLYIGSSTDLSRRRRAWFDCLDCFDGHLSTRRPASFGVSERIAEAFREVGSVGWRFRVLERLSADRLSFLAEAEMDFIEVAKAAHGDRCLNTDVAGHGLPFGRGKRVRGPLR